MENLTRAFGALRKKGYFARQNFWCCQSCGWAAIPAEKTGKVVFFHNQDNRDKIKGKPFMLAWAGDGQEIVDTLKEFGVETSWDGDSGKRIQVVKW